MENWMNTIGKWEIWQKKKMGLVFLFWSVVYGQEFYSFLKGIAEDSLSKARKEFNILKGNS